MWAVPGGHVESNETVTQAIERETYEETGLRANHVVGEFATLFWEGSSGRRCAQLNFTVTVEQSEPIQLSSEEHSEWKWVTESELLKLPCSEGMASVFTNAFREADAMASEAPTILKE
jgi:ADP-ribose pyrophosphatase YjhB (NUDIX family)